MKFTVNAKDFHAALKKADKVRLHKSALPSLEGVHISATGNICTLLATNHERWLSIPLKAEVKSPGSVTLDEIKALLKKIELLREDTLTFELPSEERSLTITSKWQKFIQRTIRGPFAEMPKAEKGQTYSYTAEALKTRCNSVKYAMSSDLTRPVYTGIHFNGTDVVTMDMYRAALSTDNSLNITRPFTVPVDVLIAAKIMRGAIELKVDSKFLTISDGQDIFMCRLLCGDFMDYREVFKPKGNRVVINRKSFLESLEFLKAFAPVRKSAFSKMPVIAWEGNTLTLHETENKCEVDFPHPMSGECAIGFQVQYMIEALKQFDTDEIMLAAKGSLEVMLLEDGASQKALVLPHKV